MQHTPSETTHEFPCEVAEYAEVARSRSEAARLIAARRYWQRTKRSNNAVSFADQLRQQNTDLSR